MPDFVAPDVPIQRAEPDVQTRDRLVNAAIEVFLEKGYGGTRVQDIARRAGFTSGALYVHFPSRTAILGEAIIREGQSIVTGLAERMDAVDPSIRPLDQLAALLSEMATGEPTRLDLLLLEALALASRSGEAKTVLSATLDAFVETVVARIASAGNEGDIDPTLDSDAIRQVFVSWIFGGVVTKSLRLNTAPPDAVAAVTSRLVGGLAPSA